MSDTQAPWSNDPNAPQITYEIYVAEKTNFAGNCMSAMSYGITIVLFFKCMSALFDPVNRKRVGIKWGLVAHTVAMFTFVTVFTATAFDLQSISYVDYQDFPGVDGLLPSGPLGYQFFIEWKAISVIPTVMLFLNQWLGDGFLLYRCYIIYAMNHWVIAFPFLMYLATFAMGIVIVYETSQPYTSTGQYEIGTAYFSVAVSLNVILTLMIIARLVLHSRNIRKATGEVGVVGIYKAIVTMLVESSALYAIVFLLYIGPWGANSAAEFLFSPVLIDAEVIAPFLITLRVANQSALTSQTVVSGDVGTMRFSSESTTGIGSLDDGEHVRSPDAKGETSGGSGAGANGTINEAFLSPGV